MVNRAAIVVKYKAPAVKWINEVDPLEPSIEIIQDFINAERTVYLISEEDAWDDLAVEDWLERNYNNLFESELEAWFEDPKLWPKNRTLDLFHEWFELERHTVVIDTLGTPIFDDEMLAE